MQLWASVKSWIGGFCNEVLKVGPIPRHIAVIMDGNRRFAKKKSLERSEGHLKGFDKLLETLEWCQELGVTEVTVYAFSIENFSRSQEEVDGLMELARQKFTHFMQERDMIERNGLCIRVIGNVSLLPKDLQDVISQVVHMTKHHNRTFLNVCFAYTSRDEICCAMRELAQGVQMGHIKESDISETLLSQCLYTNKSPDPDLILRTSGEVRLSDFLLWQSTFSVLSFIKVLWPEFTDWDLRAAVVYYQKNYDAIQAARRTKELELAEVQRQSDYACVQKEMAQDTACPQERLQQYELHRQERTRNFVSIIDTKREKFFDDIYQNLPVSLCTQSSKKDLQSL
ncbi:hypothetical protein NP493_997g01065 [Ridgeia piscesae]|uniref:Alkyl transferase n=1 Tax=Ridgeia piscesae TaxID=27915 RepID=A0AAD9KJ11_RIDPI|nr:hypothetical protein NP493_997g01065 [Ridgeia piscesae]